MSKLVEEKVEDYCKPLVDHRGAKCYEKTQRINSEITAALRVAYKDQVIQTTKAVVNN